MCSLTDPSELTEYLRFRTYLLGKSFTKPRKLFTFSSRTVVNHEILVPLASPIEPSVLADEISTIPYHQRLLTSGALSVYYAAAEQIPETLKEIGRLREETFRAVAEGTGKPRDLDRFDSFYIHLFVWNNKKKEIVGAYRLGKTDVIVPHYGKKYLYTHTLFKYGDKFLKELGPALEMGRSFIRVEYQKSYSSLLLLWKGIGLYVSLHPQYKILFGPVSISNSYHAYCRELMATFLKRTTSLPDLSKMVKPRNRFRSKQIKGLHKREAEQWWNDIEELSSWISTIEQDRKGIPVLLKQYLKLGGRVLCFNLDPDFSNALDSLIIVDLTRTDPKVLKRYMGEEGFNYFHTYHTPSNSHFSPFQINLAKPL